MNTVSLTEDPCAGLALIRQQLADGMCPAQVFNDLVGDGLTREQAVASLLEALPDEDPGELRQLLRPSPQPSFEAASIELEGRCVRPLMQRQQPDLALFADFLGDDECDRLIAAARAMLKPSTVFSEDGSGLEGFAGRTSQGCFLQPHGDALVRCIFRRAATLLDWPASHFEGLQVLRYADGAQYVPHQDYFSSARAGGLRNGGQRVATLVMYLNTPALGGATAFPELQTDVRACKGHALFFSYPVADMSSRTLHAGSPVLEGEKWAATLWLRQGPWRRRGTPTG